MKLRTKTIITVSLLSLLIFGAMQIITVLIIRPSFTELETQETKEGITQANSVIKYRLSQLISKVKDYSFWDDTYNFVQNGNEDYVEDNFIEDTFENLNLNLIAVIDNNRNLVYCQSFDFNNSTKVQTSEETKSALSSNDSIWTLQSTEDTVSGIMLVDNQPAMIASAPILTSLCEGPIMGNMVFGKVVDNQEISELSEIMDLNFSLQTITDFRHQEGGTQITESLLFDQQTIVRANSPDIISGYALIEDINSNPLFILTITQSRTIYQQEIVAGNIFMVAAVLFSFCFGAFMLFLLEREIVKPMTNLASYIEEISLNPNAPPPKTLAHSSEELDVVTNSVRATLKRKLEGMSEAARMVGHDLRNPLTGINNAAYVLKKHISPEDESGKEMLKTIEDCVDYSDKIVSDLLEYSCQITLDKIRTNPKKLVDDSLSTVSVPSNIEVVNKANDEPAIYVDNGKIERVFSNLIKNAIDAMPNGGRLETSSRKEGKKVEITFSDTGVGMSKAVLENLSTPFFTTKAIGMGVGLSICRRIVEAHGGRIEVQSSEGKGSCFTVLLPMHK